MTNLPQIKEADIKRWVGERSYSRGYNYFDGGNIYNTVRQGMTLKANCYGTMPKPYRLEITLSKDGIEYGDCSCPVGDDGDCKHIAALLLKWLYEPEAFTELEELEISIAKYTKEELIVIIKRMIMRYPELEDILALPIVPKDGGIAEPLDIETLCNQVDNLIDSVEAYEYESAFEVTVALQPIKGQNTQPLIFSVSA